MATPQYRGEKDFQRIAGISYGVDEEGLQWIDVPFRGANVRARKFFAKYPAGSNCPITGFQHLRSTTYPEITEDNGAYSTATIRFEGIEPGESKGEASDATVKFNKELKSISLKQSNSSEAIPANFTYEAPIVVASYKSKSEPKNYRYERYIKKQECPKLIRFEGPDDTTEPRMISAWNPLIVEHPKNGDIVCRTHSVIKDKELVRGEGHWNVTEYHAKFLEAR